VYSAANGKKGIQKLREDSTIGKKKPIAALVQVLSQVLDTQMNFKSYKSTLLSNIIYEQKMNGTVKKM